MGRGGAVKIFSQTMIQSLNQLISDKAVYRTAPATPGLLKTWFSLPPPWTDIVLSAARPGVWKGALPAQAPQAEAMKGGGRTAAGTFGRASPRRQSSRDDDEGQRNKALPSPLP